MVIDRKITNHNCEYSFEVKIVTNSYKHFYIIKLFMSAQKARFLSQPTEDWGPAQRSSAPLPGESELSPPVLLLHGRHVLRERGA